MHDPAICLIWLPRVTFTAYRYSYGYSLLLNVYSQNALYISRLERHSTKREIVSSSPAVGKNFSFCNSRFLRFAHSLNQSIQMTSVVTYT